MGERFSNFLRDGLLGVCGDLAVSVTCKSLSMSGTKNHLTSQPFFVMILAMTGYDNNFSLHGQSSLDMTQHQNMITAKLHTLQRLYVHTACNNNTTGRKLVLPFVCLSQLVSIPISDIFLSRSRSDPEYSAVVESPTTHAFYRVAIPLKPQFFSHSCPLRLSVL